MAITGIITEYNPFHNGHLYQLQKIREHNGQAGIICVMSGSFTQRGEAAIADKWTRARLAVLGGADLVLELPFVFAVRSAQDFAGGGVRLLERLGIADTLAFGTEYDDIAMLQKLSDCLRDEATQAKLHERLQAGLSYAAALSTAAASQSGLPEELLREPNTILALEYLQALQRFSCQLQPLIVKRRTSHYHDTEIHACLASATAIRTELSHTVANWQLLRQAMPPASLELLKQKKEQDSLPSMEYLFRPLITRIRCMSYADLRNIYSVNEGLEYKISEAAQQSSSLRELLKNIKSKRYPQSRLQRMLLYILLAFSPASAKSFDAAGPLYARVLAFNGTGRELLRGIKEHATIPLITKTGHYLHTQQRAQGFDSLSLLQQMLAYDTWSSELYALCFKNVLPGTPDFTTSPLYIKTP